MSLFTIFTVLFVGLKLTNIIDWDWWQVLLPTIIHIFGWLSVIFLVAYGKTK